MGCPKFRNYKHILQVSRGGEWVDGGEFPPSLGSFATIPKSNCSGPLDRTKYKYLDAVHMDIAFGDCLSIGGFCYALILVDCATWYNWTFGLKMLTLDSILSTLCLFCALVLWRIVFTVTVTLSCLVPRSVNISSTLTQRSLLLPPNANRLTVLLSPTARLWSIWVALTS